MISAHYYLLYSIIARNFLNRKLVNISWWKQGKGKYIISKSYTSRFLWPADVGLILHSTVQFWLLQVQILKVLWGYSDATVTGATLHAVLCSHNTFLCTPTCSSHSDTASYETYVTSQDDVYKCTFRHPVQLQRLGCLTPLLSLR